MNSASQKRLEIANLALATFLPSVRLYQARELRMCWDARQPQPKHDFPARLRNSGDWTQYGYRQRPTGSTGMQALAQMIRFVRDLPRLPLITWKYWAGDKINLCTPRTVELLKEGGYGDPLKTLWVLCGVTEFKRGLDGVVGPSCFGGRCREHGEETLAMTGSVPCNVPPAV